MNDRNILSIFVDESGNFSFEKEASRFYIVCLVMHNQNSSIEDHVRKLDSDFNRTERQRKVIKAIVEKAKGQANPVGVFGLISTAKDVAPFIETTLSVSDFWNLVFGLTACLTKSGAENIFITLATTSLPPSLYSICNSQIIRGRLRQRASS